MTSAESLGEALLDEALVSRLVPWPCPTDFGPDGRYRLEEIIGVGQTSLVYRAVDTHMSSEGFDAMVAIKIVGAEGRQRQEALNARRVRHDHVVRILDRGVAGDGANYIVEELVEGQSLESQKVPWPARGAVSFMVKVARGMQAVHAAGVVHCDLKPANVLITEAGEPKISDFGLATTGAIEDVTGGNLAFISPERFADAVAGLAPPTDVYALAGLLYYLLTGRSPHGATIEEARAYLTGTDPVPALPVDPILDVLCRRSLSRDPAERHHSAGEFANDLEAWLRREPIRWTRPTMWQEVSLFVRRHAVGVGAAALVCASILAIAGGWIGLELRARADDQRAAQEAVALADQQIEAIQARVRQAILTLARAVPSADQSGLDLASHHLATMLWLDQIAAHPLLEEIRRTTVEEEHIRMLGQLAAELRARGDGRTLDALLADHTLAFLLLKHGDWRASGEISGRAIDTWAGRLDAAEPVWLSMAALHETALIVGEAEGGADVGALASRLEALESEIAGSSPATHYLIVQVRTSLMPSHAQ